MVIKNSFLTLQSLLVWSRYLCVVDRVVQLWRESLAKGSPKAAQSLADPTEYENLFPGLKESFKAEQFLRSQRRTPISARNFPSVQVRIWVSTLSVDFSVEFRFFIV